MTTAPSRAPGIRARNRTAIEAEILTVGRRHLAEHGAAALSLRAVARDLGMVSSAVYRYVDSRDELLTRLIVASYTSMADTVDVALRRHGDPTTTRELRRAWDALTTAMRRWALDRPHEWALLYGSPVPDYEAPQDRTNDAGTRVMFRLLALRPTARMTSTSVEPYSRAARRAARALLDDAPALLELGLTPDVLLDCSDAWTMVVGAISREVFGQLGPLPDAEAMYAASSARAYAIYAPR